MGLCLCFNVMMAMGMRMMGALINALLQRDFNVRLRITRHIVGRIIHCYSKLKR
jgi:hypothetical protein